MYMKIISPDRGNDDIELPNLIQQETDNPNKFLKKNLASRAPQKSDDFKVTFAYTSNKSSLDGM